jgi:hypothetical protein
MKLHEKLYANFFVSDPIMVVNQGLLILEKTIENDMRSCGLGR